MRFLALAAAALLAGFEAAAAPATSDAPVDASPGHIAELILKLDGAGMSNQVRARAAYLELKKIGKPAAAQLLEALGNESPWIRLWAAAALADLHEARAIDPMLKLLKDPHPTTRTIATYHISSFHKDDPRIAPAVARQLEDASPDVRRWAESALKRIRLQGAVGELEKLVRSDSPWARQAAFKLLLEQRSKDIEGDIRRAIETEKDWHVRSAAVRVVGDALVHAGEETFDMLLKALGDPHDEVKADAAEVLNGILGQVMDRMPEELRTRVLGELGKKLPPLLDAKLPRLRGAAMYLLSAGEREALYPRALAALDDASPEVRVYAFKTLGRCGRKTHEVVEKAVANLADEDLEVRAVALASLRWATGESFEYDPKAPAKERQEAIARIRERLGAGRPGAKPGP